MVGIRRAIALLFLGFYVTQFAMTAWLGPDELYAAYLGLALCYTLAFVGLAAKWFWARWFAIGVGNFGSLLLLVLLQVGMEPIIREVEAGVMCLTLNRPEKKNAFNTAQWVALAEALPADYQAKLEREYPRLGRYPLDPQAYDKASGTASGAQLWLVDPHGNLVLRYPAGSDGKAILDDLRYLLKISLIG